MSTAPRLLAFSGSARHASFNRKLIALAVASARALGVEVTLIELRDLQLPVYDGDLEAAGMPAGALELRRQFAAHDALLVSTPEYNNFPPPLLINAMDWMSRTQAADGQPAGLAAIAGKPAGVMSASPGIYGATRSLLYTRQYLGNTLGMLVVPEQFALTQAMKAFDEHGALLDEKQAQGMQRVVAGVVRVATALKAARPA